MTPSSQSLCLNAATIRHTPLAEQVRIAAHAGFNGIGLWVKDINASVDQGMCLSSIAQLVSGNGLDVPELCFVGGWQEAGDQELDGVLTEGRKCFQIAHSY